MLFTLDLFRKVHEQLFEIVVKVLFEPVNHSLVVIFNDALFDVLALQDDSLLSASYGIDQVCAIVSAFSVQMELVYDMLVFP